MVVYSLSGFSKLSFTNQQHNHMLTKFAIDVGTKIEVDLESELIGIVFLRKLCLNGEES